MRTKKEIQEIYQILGVLFPDAHCELIHNSAYQLLIAVMLSAQTTDASVNICTKRLFEEYPTVEKMSRLSANEIEIYIKRLGLSKTKAMHVYECNQMLMNQFAGEVPSTIEELTKLPGIGRKSASVVLSCWFHVPAFPVDTHVERISKRLGISKKDASVLEVEKNVCKGLEKEQYYAMHHRMIFFGRYMCKAKNPDCTNCPLKKYCKEKPLKA